MVAAGIDYVTSLAEGRLAGSRIVINMSLGDTVQADDDRGAIDRAIAAGVIVVAVGRQRGRGRHGLAGRLSRRSSRRALPAGPASGSTTARRGNAPANGVRYRMFWLQDTHGNLTPPLLPDSGDVAEPGYDDVYVTDFSSREKAGQDLDVARARLVGPRAVRRASPATTTCRCGRRASAT